MSFGKAKRFSEEIIANGVEQIMASSPASPTDKPRDRTISSSKLPRPSPTGNIDIPSTPRSRGLSDPSSRAIQELEKENIDLKRDVSDLKRRLDGNARERQKLEKEQEKLRLRHRKEIDKLRKQITDLKMNESNSKGLLQPMKTQRSPSTDNLRSQIRRDTMVITNGWIPLDEKDNTKSPAGKKQKESIEEEEDDVIDPDEVFIVHPAVTLTIQAPNEEDLLKVVSGEHDDVISHLTERRNNLKQLQWHMERNSISESVDRTLRQKDPATMIELLYALNQRTDLWNIKLCSMILPPIKGILLGNNKIHAEFACESLKIILEIFGKAIKSNNETQFQGRGVNIAMEERQQNSTVCLKHLKDIRKLFRTKPDVLKEHFGKTLSSIELRFIVLD